MSAALTGRIHGTVIELDAALPEFEGQRVHVVIEPVDEAGVVDTEALRDAWQAWAEKGPTGPIVDDGEPEFP